LADYADSHGDYDTQLPQEAIGASHFSTRFAANDNPYSHTCWLRPGGGDLAQCEPEDYKLAGHRWRQEPEVESVTGWFCVIR